jgi:hypothetical protein
MAYGTGDNNTNNLVGNSCSAENLVQVYEPPEPERRYLKQQPKGSSAWSVPYCSRIFQSSKIIVHEICNYSGMNL